MQRLWAETRYRDPARSRSTYWSLVTALRCLATVIAWSTLSAGARAGDWPQIHGPHRNTKADGEQLITWPADGPRQLWQAKVGRGFAGPAVADHHLVLFHRLADQLVAEARQPATGKLIWKQTFPTRYSSGISSDDGPRCVPLIHRDRVYLVGPAGELICVLLASGKQVWARQAYQEFTAPDGYFGAGSSPIVIDDKLLWNVGGGRGAGLVAFALADGKTVWKSTNEQASYSSPVEATIDGTRHIVFVTRLSTVSIDADNGAVRFRFPFGARGPTVNAANPLVLGDHVFVSASYGVGAQWAKIGPDSAHTDWESDEVMSSQYTTCSEKDGLLYGIDGRQDVGVARLRCIDPAQGKVRWTQDGYGTGNLIQADGKLLILKTDGRLELVDPTPQGYRPLASTQLLDTTVQALPALADGLLYVRDTETLKCVVVGRTTAAP